MRPEALKLLEQKVGQIQDIDKGKDFLSVPEEVPVIENIMPTTDKHDLVKLINFYIANEALVR